MAAGEVVEVTATADEDTVTVTFRETRMVLSAPTVDPADPGVMVLTVPKSMTTFDGWAVRIPVEA